ncbi:mannosyltransferase family protein [Synechococcus sp. PCC 7336]|uniref:mannosyltransferase family protein n=1 Tax=Synechococcus sp. PCC 7336 TaxID=195250 RepID=UPI00034B00E3|nr:mannosyltransferase family protein [Synechococcus sp. PCC 7336]
MPDRPPASVQPSFIWLSVAALLTIHFALWSYITATSDLTWLTILGNWDSGHYVQIVKEGYSVNNWAFLPLYPTLLGIFSHLTRLQNVPQIAGSILSSAIFIAWIAGITAIAQRPNLSLTEASLWHPKTRLGWLFFAFSPASFAFHTNHTESLFLALSFSSLYLARTGRWLPSAVLAGLSTLTRNQGVFVITIAAYLAAQHLKTLRSRLQRVITLCAIATPFGLSYILYQYLETGNPLKSVSVQSEWSQATSLLSVLKTFWFGNEWQNTELGSILHHAVFFVVVGVAIAIWKASPPLSAYLLVSMGVMLLQGELVNVFRYGAVLFPAWFWLGDRLSRTPAWLRYSAIALLVGLNLAVTRNYALARWAY